MRYHLLRVVLAAAFAAGAAGAAAAAESSPDADGLASPDGQYLDWMDRAVPPRLDFFRYANGGWIKTHPMPPDRSYWGADTLLEQKNQRLIRDLLESVSKDNSGSKGSVQRKAADFYYSGMDESGIDAAGIAPLQPEFDRIDAIADRNGLQAEFAHLQMIGVAAPLQLSQMQDFKDSTRIIAPESGLLPEG